MKRFKPRIFLYACIIVCSIVTVESFYNKQETNTVGILDYSAARLANSANSNGQITGDNLPQIDRTTMANEPISAAIDAANTAPPDPYATWGGYGNYQKAVGDYTSAKNVAYGSIGDAENNAASGYKNSILDFVDQYRTGQNGINRSAVQNELSRSAGRLNVLDLVGNGLRSGGVMLAGKNATTSSAADQLAKVYNQIGRRELSKVGNQYELGANNIAGQQEDLNASIPTFQRHADLSKNQAVNSIVSDAVSKLSQLNAAAQNASLPDRIAIEQEKARISAEATGRLAAFDAELTNGVSANGAHSVDQNRADASRLLTAGTAPENSFNYSTSIPAQFRNTGPFAGDLPLFFGGNKRQDQFSPAGA